MAVTIRNVILGLLLATLGAVSSWADDEPRTHDGGFFMRLAVGPARGSTKIAADGDALELRGWGGSFDGAFGFNVKRNLALHGTLNVWSTDHPTAEFDGIQEDLDGSLAVGFLGAGVTWYHGPSNVYLTASAGAGLLQLEIDGDREESDYGFMFDVGVGKEWWVSDKWGLGASVNVSHHTIPPGGAEGDFKGPSVSVRFSATRN